jgi:hypothetical protein
MAPEKASFADVGADQERVDDHVGARLQLSEACGILRQFAGQLNR